MLCVAGTVLAVLSAFGAGALAHPAQPSPPEHLSWYGDPGAPDISGVWVRADDQGMSVGTNASPEGWRPWPPPLKGAFSATWKKRVAAAAAGERTDDPIMGCMIPGMPRFITGDKSSLLIIQNHGRVMFYRDGEQPRRVWLDGRSSPASADLEPFPKGTAIGHYENSDLIIESIGFKDQPIDSTGAPHSDKLRISERYHRVDPQTLAVHVTLTDLVALSRSMTTTVIYKALNNPLWEPYEFICTPQTDYHPDRYVK
jgi:hypothetical protein